MVVNVNGATVPLVQPTELEWIEGVLPGGIMGTYSGTSQGSYQRIFMLFSRK